MNSINVTGIRTDVIDNKCDCTSVRANCPTRLCDEEVCDLSNSAISRGDYFRHRVALASRCRVNCINGRCRDRGCTGAGK